mmetsp:Transcript_4884/g.11870  ORF Transcript_4884/g.11870 Transcript_4884/m.11870 type:complete len:342 (+) Transcript_4884:875-1900(+)
MTSSKTRFRLATSFSRSRRSDCNRSRSCCQSFKSCLARAPSISKSLAVMSLWPWTSANALVVVESSTSRASRRCSKSTTLSRKPVASASARFALSVDDAACCSASLVRTFIRHMSSFCCRRVSMVSCNCWRKPAESPRCEIARSSSSACNLLTLSSKSLFSPAFSIASSCADIAVVLSVAFSNLKRRASCSRFFSSSSAACPACPSAGVSSAVSTSAPEASWNCNLIFSKNSRWFAKVRLPPSGMTSSACGCGSDDGVARGSRIAGPSSPIRLRADDRGKPSAPAARAGAPSPPLMRCKISARRAPSVSLRPEAAGGSVAHCCWRAFNALSISSALCVAPA